MTKKKQTKRALLSSIVSLILCFTMLLGTTFAWFTDTASTGRNVIKSGNLDIELYYKTSLEDEEWKAIGEDTEIFSYDKWEPGYTQVVYLKTANKGSLALKYNVAASVYKEILGKTKDGADIKLSDYLKAGYLEVAAFGNALSAEEMMAITVESTFENSRSKFAAFAEGTMSNFEQYGGKNLNEFDAASGSVLLPGEEHVGVLAITMPTTVTNEANHNGTDIPEIQLGLTVVATQHTEEYDSFGNDYDKDAAYPVVLTPEDPMTITEGTHTLKNVRITGTEESPNALTIAGDANVVIEGTVELIGAKNGSGIYVAEGAKLDLSGATLIAKGNAGAENADEKTAGGSGIGGEGTIYIHDMDNLTAEGYGVAGFGIGGNSESITIEDTTITYAKGGFVQAEMINDTEYGKSEPEGGAAIGSMYNGATITLNNVTVINAKGGSKAAGIGGRYWTGVTVKITDSIINNVEGGNGSAGIGGSRIKHYDAAEQEIAIIIEDSTINAKGGQYGAGIGSGYDTYVHSYAEAPECDIQIKGDSVISAVGGKYAAGIGTGYHAGKLSGEIESSVSVQANPGEAVYRDTYTAAMGVGFGVLDPARDGANNGSTFTWGDKEITVPSVSATGE